MEEIKIKKVIHLEKKIKDFNNPILTDKYSFIENEEGIKVIGNMNLNGEVLYENEIKERLNENFEIEFYIFNEQIDYTLIRLLSFDFRIDKNNLIINMIFSKEKKVIEKDGIENELDKIEIDDYKNEVLVEDINFDELERIISSKDTIMFSSLDMEENDDDEIEIILEEDKEIEEKNNDFIEVNIEEDNKDDLVKVDMDKEDNLPIIEEKKEDNLTKKESLFKEEYRKTYLYYRMKETDTIESLSSLYRNNMDSLIVNKAKYKKNDIICIKLKWKKN